MHPNSLSIRNPLAGLRRLAGLLALGGAGLAATAADPTPAGPLWLRYPAVSPDGTTIAFTYGGQVWRVPAAGGEAVPLTSGEFYATRPVWSPDGTKLAFASKQHGNLDVFIMPAAGGEINRLTENSANDQPFAFSPDGKQVYFASPRLGSPETVLAGDYAGSDQLYAVPAAGGPSRLVLPTPALDVSADPSGQWLLYENRPIYENDWRKGAISDGTHDVWLYHMAEKTHRRLTDFRGEDRNPVWAPDAPDSYYYLSEQSGSFNVWRGSLAAGTAPVPITTHRVGPVRFLSVARDGTLVYGLEGEIWRRPPGGSPAQHVPVIIRQGSLVQGGFFTDAADQMTELTVAPDGRQLALVARGEIFVLSTETGRTRRITRTPSHERQVSFAPDSRSLVYVSERDGDMDIFEATLGEPAMKSFADPGPIKERKLIDTAGDLQYPKISPDGKRLAYLADRNRILVLDRAAGTTVTALPEGNNYSYSDDDFSFCWSPDSRWLAATAGSYVTSQDIVLLDGSGQAAPLYLTRSGYFDTEPQFSPDGQAVAWFSAREGLRAADGMSGQVDVFIAHLTQASFDAARGYTAAATPGVNWQPKAAGLALRTQRVTPFSADFASFRFTPDGQSLLVFNREPTGRITGYQISRQGDGLKQVFAKPAFGAADFDATVQNLYTLTGSALEKINFATGATVSLPVDTSLEVDLRGELAYWFQHFWRLTKLKFYEPTMHGRDWDAIRARYARFLPHLHTWEDFAEMMSEMAGELNASHMGCSYLKPTPYADRTASLGLYYDDTYAGPGIRIASVLPGGPADAGTSHLKPGAVILAINGTAINERTSLDGLLNHASDGPVQLHIQGADGTVPVSETIVPITADQATALSTESWVAKRKALTETLSGGRLGYVYLPEMSPEVYKRAYSEVMGDNQDKQGLVIDIRYNGGGLLHDQLLALFTGEVYAGFTNRQGELIGRIPTSRWAKPTALLQNAGAYSDGSIFPHLYQRAKLGPIIGDRVPGTGTAVWWMYVMNNSLKWGVPELGAKDFQTGWFENQEIVPDLLVSNDPAAVAAGRDPQLEAAVAALLRQIPARPAPSPSL